MQSAIVTIDGSEGEGGGQMLRSSLSLSMITGKAFKISNIRAGREKPGLMRQHLTSVKAAAEISNAKVIGAELGAQELFFIPKKVKGGTYNFAIGTAGSTTLVAQTIIPALILADVPSTITLEGGTHNTHSPPYDFIKNSYLPVLKKMGVAIDANIHKHGFYPTGGGKIVFNINPIGKLAPIELTHRGEQKNLSANACFANLPADIAKRELATIGSIMQWPQENLNIRQIQNSTSPGNVVVLNLEYEEITETIISFGRFGVKAEKVAEEACKDALEYISSSAAVGVHLADQLLLPIILAGGGCFTTLKPSLHTLTNIEVIKKFIPCSIVIEEQQANLWKISIKRL